MELSYRKGGEGVKLSVKVDDKDIILKVPENMYFIGTMNMIDFSLEQVDFALRRRFLWRLSTYDAKRLEDILSEKVEEKISDINDSEF
jgi:5-methylcytosine-specific restriction protein B